MANIKETLRQQFENAVILSQGNRWYRLLHDPVRTLRCSLAFRRFHASKEKKPFYDFCRTFWRRLMYVALPEGSTFYQWGFINGDPEIILTRVVIDRVQAGGIFFDIGAHYGFYSMLASELVGSQGHVYAFEPTPRTFSILKKNTQELSNVTITQSPVWESKTHIQFTDFGVEYGAFNTYLGTTTDKHVLETAHKTVLNLETVTIDDFVAQHGIRDIQFMKIDVENAELFVVKGAVNTLRRFSPIVCVELWTVEHEGITNNELLEYLGELGYAPFVVDKDLRFIPYEETKIRDTYTNVFMIKR